MAAVPVPQAVPEEPLPRGARPVPLPPVVPRAEQRGPLPLVREQVRVRVRVREQEQEQEQEQVQVQVQVQVQDLVPPR